MRLNFPKTELKAQHSPAWSSNIGPLVKLHLVLRGMHSTKCALLFKKAIDSSSSFITRVKDELYRDGRLSPLLVLVRGDIYRSWFWWEVLFLLLMLFFQCYDTPQDLYDPFPGETQWTGPPCSGKAPRGTLWHGSDDLGLPQLPPWLPPIRLQWLLPWHPYLMGDIRHFLPHIVSLHPWWQGLHFFTMCLTLRTGSGTLEELKTQVLWR